MRELVELARDRAESLVADTVRLVSVESPSPDPEASRASAEAVAALLRERLGADVATQEIDGHVHVRATWGEPRVLLLCHHDTVWPAGTLARFPVVDDGETLRGPGTVDMKAGIAVAVHALAILREQGGDAALDGVDLLITADEELGSPTSRAIIEASTAKAALVFEAAAHGGEVKTARKGVSIYRLEVVGRAAHAGVEPEQGVNAAVALAHAILATTSLGDAAAGTSVTPTVLQAGTTTNTVPASAWVSIDVRAWTEAEQVRVDDAIRALESPLEGARLVVHGGINRPPLERAMAVDLYTTTAAVAAELGFPPLQEAAVGGGSDGNFTAGAGIPTLDGLGPWGGGAHAEHEHAVRAALPQRTALVAGLLRRLLG
ncbi:M20 family metallopeptidase [Agrococcus versicolor]|uniref:M20 family metallopeptidase n=1 Tax=Agrococcus versicolor TaxID=501482 RepID=A0ABP5M9I6_9MICO